MIFNHIGGGGSKAPTLKFSTPYGTAPGEQVATFDEPDAPSQTGYTFGGWYSDADLTEAYDWASEAKAGTVYAKWAIAAPTVAQGSGGTYDGTAKALGTVTAKGSGQTVEYSLDGSTWSTTAPTATAAGSYTVRWRVTAEHCDTLSGQFTVTIATATMSVTTTDKSATYSGNSVQANTVKVSTPASGYTVKYGKAAGTYDLTTPPTYTTAGEYTVYYQVTADNYTTVAGTYKVTIAKASCALSISPTSLTVKEADGGTGAISVTRTGSGAVTATSSNTDAATVSVSGTTVTVTYVGAGSATVTVKVAATTNYEAGSATCAVTTESALEIVTWAAGTDAQIAAMVEAADNGQIDLTDYWSVGDTRTVSLSAMRATGVGESHSAKSVQMVLMNAGGKTLASNTAGGRSTCSFIVGLKDSLATAGYMNGSNTNSGGWESCARRTWCNSVFRNAVPATLRGCFKQFKNVTASGSSTATTTSTDYFALPSEKEVFGSVTYANSTAEASNSQFEWYKTASNRIKKLGTSGSAYDWWERSPGSGYSGIFCRVGSDGTAYLTNASYTRGLSPFGCI